MKLLQLLEMHHYFLYEGYKEATADFSIEADKETVTSVIDQYKELVKRNQVLGDQRNIDYWRKQGWNKFNSFVETKSSIPSVTQVKRKKIAGNSITLQEDDNWLIVVPLDKDASCFHGKNSDWCTTKVDKAYFERYFYNFGITLIYCLNKTNGGMWAIAVRAETGEIEFFNKEDHEISEDGFNAETGLEAHDLVQLLKDADKATAIDSSRTGYKELIAKIMQLLKRQAPGETSIEIEQLLIRAKDADLDQTYILKASGGTQVDSFSPEFQIYAITQYGQLIKYIKEPSEKLQLIAIKQTASAISGIQSPTERAQLAAISADPVNIKYIKNPSEHVQKTTIKNGDYSLIQYIKNPSEDILVFAVTENPDAIKFIASPSERVQLAAVTKDGDALFFIKKPKPSERVEIAAVMKYPLAIRHINNPSEELQLMAVKANPDAIRFIRSPSQAAKEAAQRAAAK